ncbi:alpha-ketoglutarate-dependent dioxygenase AlkB family protein [Streptomyces sp. BI20]|uniref:alpha-ketoglutarate-dependent dioxygenase AlkB family protein n=1 Tax=Streptomyces sp. BI20 TaxID=3403460 RepID=UPI003C7529C7
MTDDGLFPRNALPPGPARTPVAFAPGAVHLPDWLDPAAQAELLAHCRRWATGPAGLRTVHTPGGGTMSARQVCLGNHWYPYGYARTAVDGDGAPVKPMPAFLAALGARALTAAHALAPEDLPAHAPAHDTALINFYGPGARMGMHRDAEERDPAPVVSLSLGDDCVFRFGTPQARGGPHTDLTLRSGDLVVFGGPSRLAYHGVPKVLPGTGPGSLGLTGRLNITLRVADLG